MIKKIFATVAFLLLLFFPQEIFAAAKLPDKKPEFATSYDVLYDVDEDGVTTVTEKIILKNLTSEYYANEFKLTIGASQISDIKASDSLGLLQTKAEQKGNSTIIGVDFNQQVAGVNKTLPWTISFKSKDFAEKVGKVWEIRVPKINSANIESYNLTLSVPQVFGELSLISPAPKGQSISAGKIFLTFDKEQLFSSGISANFGTNQIFDFDLTYHLENKKLMPVLTNIALPPDTGFQDVIYQRIDPMPLNVTVDNDGNYLAWFRLVRGQKIDVKVIGSAKLYTSSKVKSPFLEETLKNKYTQPQKYWEQDNPQIINKLNEILGTNTNASTQEKAKLIFQFVEDTLKYDSKRVKDSVERLGAVTVLANPTKALCMEFTDLFIALARAAGIPSRQLDGYAYTTNINLRPTSSIKNMHSWPEYFDEKKGWVMVDPTWANTTGGIDYFSKLDLNHFVFAVKGFSSTEPIPAGSYKYNNIDSNDIKVTLSENDFLGKPQIDVRIEAPQTILAGFPGVIKVKVLNSGNSIFPQATLNVGANKFLILASGKQKLGLIPPFGSAEFDFNVRTKSLFDRYSDQVVVYINGQKFVKEVNVAPFVLFQTAPFLLVGITAILVYILILGAFIYRKKIVKRKRSKK